MKNSKKKERIERRKLADGSIRVYRYGARITKRPDTKTVSRIIGRWQNSPDIEALAKSTAQAYCRYIAPLYDAYKAAEITTIKRRHILCIRDSLAKTKGHGAALQFCKTVAVFFKWVVEQDILEFSPAHNLKDKLRQGEWAAWTMEQALAAESLFPAQYARAIFLARHTAQRRGDLCAMKWSDYNGSEIQVTQQKTGVRLAIPVISALKEALDQWKAETKGLTILQHPDGRPIKPSALSCAIPKSAQRIGLPAGLNIHGLRKLAAAVLADAGCSTHEIASITGHSTLAMVQHYTKSANQRTLSKAAVVRLDSHQKLQNGKKSEAGS